MEIESFNTHDELLHGIVKRTSHSVPESLAVESWDGSLTYQELTDLSSSVARALIARGVQRGSFVPVLFEKSKWLPVAACGILEAGGAFVPLDDTYPLARHQSIIEQVKPIIAIVSSKNARHFEAIGLNVLVVGDDSEFSAWNHADIRANTIFPSDPAYLMYTSGTTGKPKGVIISHRSISYSCINVAPQVGFSAKHGIRSFQWASYAFDAWIYETFFALAHGGCVCIPSDFQRLNDVAGAMNALKVTHAIFTPSVAGQIGPDEVPTLKYLAMGGEKASETVANAWRGRAVVYNCYGPTEATILCSWAQVGDLWNADNIGCSVAGCKIWIVDPSNYNNLLVTGETGELLIEGILLAEGYYADPEKTKAAFIDTLQWACTDSGNAPRRFYATGDLAYVDQSGALRYVGRKDVDVRKVNGVRISLGEIEGHLDRLLPDGFQVAVEVLNLNNTDVLVAFLAIKAMESDLNTTFDEIVTSIHTDLTEVLPRSMTPSIFHRIAIMPLTSAGKVDRKSLRLLEVKGEETHNGIEHNQKYDTGRTAASLLSPEGIKLRSAWSKILTLPESSITSTSDFFASGGNSLLAMKLVRLARSHNLGLTVQTVFKHPKLASMSDAVAEHQKQTVNIFRNDKRVDISQSLINESCKAASIDPADVQDAYPSTPFQESVMSVAEMRGSPYLQQVTISIPENIGIERLKLAFKAIYSSSAILRTRIIDSSAGLLQVVFRDESPFDENESDVTTPNDFHYSLGQKLSTVRFSKRNGSAFLHWNISHSLVDRWSFSRLLANIGRIYDGQPVSSGLCFSHYANYLNSLDPAQAQHFWNQSLADVAVEQFPHISSKTARPMTNATVSKSFPITRTQTEYTMPMIVRGAWAIIIAQYTGNAGVGFTVAANGRDVDLEDIEEIDGPTLTNIPVQTVVVPSEPVAALLDALNTQILNAIPYGYIGLQGIRSAVPTFNVSDWAQNTLVIQSGDENYDLKPWLSKYLLHANYPQALMMECLLTEDEVILRATYDNAIISQLELDRILNHFGQVLTRMVDCDLTLSTVAHVGRIGSQDYADLKRWNPGCYESNSSCIHDLVTKEAERRPDSTAVCAWDGELTYGQLNTLSSSLATKLSTQLPSNSLQGQAFVPLAMDKSRLAVIAMLAILKMGAACVPIDPDLPRGQLQAILNDLGCSIVVSSFSKALKLSGKDIRTFIVSEDNISELGDSKEAHGWTVKPSDAAWVVFSSGTTGNPKGIVLEHRALCSGALYDGGILGLHEESRVFNFAAFSFDVSVADIFYTLIHGGVVCMPSDQSRLDDLAGSIKQLKANQVYLTTTVASTISPSDVPGIRRISVGGEEVSFHVVEAWSGQTTLVNIWGPAEATPWASGRVVEDIEDDPRNIGHSLGACLWLVNRDDPELLLPIGAVGEILIDGPILARGYLNRPEQTEKGFIPAPKWLHDLRGPLCPARVYRTGDIAKYSNDGCIRFIGRREHDIFAKIRGMRIELSEIEQHIRKIGHGAEVPVQIVKNSQGDRSLVAFVSDSAARLIADSNNFEENDQSSCTTWLSSQLRSGLPSHMVPQMFFRVNKLFISANGKLDRKRLQQHAEDMSSQVLADSIVGDYSMLPKSDMEQTLAKAWCSVLSVREVFRHHNFIALGGDSVRAMKLVSLARRNGVELSVQDVLTCNSLQHLALVARKKAVLDEPTEIPFELFDKRDDLENISKCVRISGLDTEIVDIYPALPFQESILASSQIQEGAYIMQTEYLVPENIDLGRLAEAWNRSVVDLPVLRTTFVVHSSQTWQVVLKRGALCETVSSDALDLYLGRARAEVSTLGTSFVLCAIVPRSELNAAAGLILTAHHAVYDKVTLHAVWRRVHDFYMRTEGVPQLPSYRRFVHYMCHKDWTESQQYWRQLLQGHEASPFPQLPASNFRVRANQVMERTFEVRFPAGSSFTPSSFLKSAWGLTVSQYSASSDVVFGTVSHGRAAPVVGIEQMPGPTVTTVPVRLRLAPGLTARDLLAMTQDQASRSLPHEQLGVHGIARLSNDLRDACRLHHLFIVQTHTAEPSTSLGLACAQQHALDFASHALTIEATIDIDGGRIGVRAQFDPNAIAAAQLSHVLRHFQHIVRRLVCYSPDVKLAELTRINTADLEEIVRWQAPPLDVVRGLLHDLVARACGARPDHLAIHAHDGRLTYAELRNVVQQTACHFQHLGVRPKMLVPVCARKGLWAPVTFLAILSCGAAFLPLEPTWPIDRLHAIMEQFHPSIIFVSPDCRSLFDFQGKENPPQVFNLGLDMVCRRSHHHAKIPADAVTPSDLAFILMTSGSTGKPKGVKIQHHAIATHCVHVAPEIGFQPSTKILQFSSYAFDGAFAETFDTLIHGGTLCLPSEFDRMNNLARVVDKMQANMIVLTPALLATLSPHDFPTLKTLIVAGDRVLQHVNDTWAPKLRLLEGYGPAESCIATSIRNASDNPRCGNLQTPSWCALWVTDPQDPETLVPIGATGELLIQGPVLASGYAGDDKKTLAAFIPPPRWMERANSGWTKSHRRLYRTGDLVRQLTDGTYQFIGRHDNMRKHRGQRLELEEIEHHLRLCLLPSEDAIVELVEPKSSAPCIVAFIQHKKSIFQPDLPLEKFVSDLENSSLSQQRSKALEDSLSSSLPPYMVPSLFLVLEQLPFLASGKVNRKLLREAIANVDITSLSPNRREILPSELQGLTSAASVLRQSWAETLGLSVEHITGDSVWHRLGGDSIRAMHLNESVRRKGYQISVHEIISAESLTGMAERMVDNTNQGSTPAPMLMSPNFAFLPSSIDLEKLFSLVHDQCNVEPESIADILPATPLQVEFMASTSMNSNAYISRQIWDLPKDIDLTRFQWAWFSVSHSMPILRTRLVSYGADVFQVLLHTLPTWDWASDLDQYLESDRKHDYRLGTELMHFGLVQNGNARKQFVWTCHHSLYDGRFMELIMKQLLGYYANAPFPTLTPFNAYIKYLREGDAQIEREFWQKKMKGATTLSFPENLDGTDSAVDGCIEMRMTLMHDNSGARYSTTLCIQSALALVLARWANSDDVMFAVTLNGRTAPIRGIDNLAGPTMSTVPLRCLVELTKQADTLMEQIRATLLELTPYQHAGISGTRRMTNKMWDLTTHLIIQPHKSRSTQLATETFFGNIRDDEAVMMDTYSINIECTVTEMSTVDITLRYKSHALDETSAKRFLHQFVDAAKQISLGPTRRMADISLLTEQDRAQIVEWNAMPVKTEEYLIHDRIHSIADMHADEAAIYSWDGEATYGQLRIMSTRLASELIAKGIGPESMVALVFDKSINAVIAMLAVLTAGGCLVPFDASHPLDRLKMMIRGVNAKLILCSASRRALCEEIAQDVLVVNAATLGLSEDPIGKAALAVTVRPDNAAYVIHTSGSTGKPKAIVITHGQYTSGDHERVKALRELSSPRSLQFVSYAFDQSLQDILSGLMIGACICIPSQSMRESVADLVDFMRQAQVNSVMWPPSFAQLVNPEDVPDLKVLDVGGEPNTKELVRKWAGRLRLVNSYGPAEASVTCTTNWHIDPSTDPRDIGTGLNMRTWIVEKDNVNRLCPVGVIGELLLDGPALARGYLNDPKKTAAAFISPPAWAEKLTSATRMYRTGDLVKYSASGSLLYIGRIDSQVKIRGNRIQLEEIQCCILRELPGVRFAIEAIRPTDKQQNALCVFIATTEDSGEIAEGDTIVVNDSNAKSHIANLVKGLKHRLAKTLPSYMLPQYFLPVYKLPRTTSDKLDRKRLVAEAERLSAAELLSIGELSIEPKRAPETTVQAFFQSLWAEVLDLSIDHIGLDDDFVEIGGDSISAMQLAAAARERNWRLSVADIFAHRTLEAVSGAASRSEGGIVEEIAPYSVMEMATTQITKRISKLLNVPSHDIQDALPCTQFQEDMVLRSLDRPGAITVRFVYNIAGFDVERFKIAWQQCHEAHPALRIRVVQLEGIFIQAIIKDHAQWAVADSLEDFLDEDKKSPMTTGDRLNRCALVYQSEKPRYFVWTAHHAIFDGWALEALMKEVCDRYSGKPITLPDPGPASFLHHLKGLDRTSMAAFWRQELSGLSSKPMLAFDFEEHPLAQQWEIRHIRFCIPPGRMFTPAILLQFSWALLLSVASASDDVVLELMLTGRTAPVARLAHTLFPTVAVVPLRFRYSPGDNVMDALLKMQTHTHGLVPYEQFGWQSILALDEEIRHTLHRSAIPLIIHPAAKQSSTIAPNLELTTMSPMLHHNVAIQFECSLDDTGAETMILFDERLLTKHKVEQLLDAFEAIVAAVVHADANATLDRILNTEAVARVTRLSGN